jgi:hypothetical protein
MKDKRMVTLKKDGILLPKSDCAGIACVEGILWITSEGDPVDVALYAGDSLSLAGRRRVCVGALLDATLEIRPAGAPARKPQKACGFRPETAEQAAVM